jgi:hypothetical protein
MALSSHDRKVLAGIEHELSNQYPELAGLFATADHDWRWQLPVLLRHFGLLVAGLLVLIIIHMVTADLNPLVSAGLTATLIISWLVATARATRGREWGSASTSRRRPGSGGGPGGRRAATPEDDRDNPDDDGCCPA